MNSFVDQNQSGKRSREFLISMLTVILLLGLLPTGMAEEMMVQVHRISGNTIVFAKLSDGSGGGMRGASSGRRPRGRFNSGNDATSRYLAPQLRVTEATYSRRTQEFSVGKDIAGGVRNRLFRQEEGVTARLVMNSNIVIEINVVTDDMTQTHPIAVKPRRPPSRQ